MANARKNEAFRIARCREVNTTHGMTGTVEYCTWTRMIGRCENPEHKSYDRYGGRGITICRRWRASFFNFLADMGHRPPGMNSIERKDNDGNYCKSNCRWATHKEQARNRSSNRLITAFGKTQTLQEWAEEVQKHPMSILKRLLRGWHPETALAKPMRKMRRRQTTNSPLVR